VNNDSRTVSGGHVDNGDLISSGWTMSIPGRHPAAAVRLTGIVATIPLRCDDGKGDDENGTSTSIVLRFPDASQSIAANDSSWHPTTAPADAQGYQVSAAAGDLCHGSASEPRGDVRYHARLASTDTRDPFLLRFHTVDARSRSPEHDDHHGANVDCSSTTANVHGRAACRAPWTRATRLFAAALSLPPTPVPVPHAPGAHGSGGAGNQPPAQLGGIRGARLGSAAAGASPATPGPPVLVLPAPSQPTVLSPVPLVVPVIDGVNAQIAGALPWKWFVVLAIIDLGLIVGLVIRRRRAVDRLGRQ